MISCRSRRPSNVQGLRTHPVVVVAMAVGFVSAVVACRPPELDCGEGQGAISLYINGASESAVCVTALRGDQGVEDGWTYISLHAALDHVPGESLHEPMVRCEFELPLGSDFAPVLGAYPLNPDFRVNGGICRFRAATAERSPKRGEEWVSSTGQVVVVEADGSRFAGHLVADMVGASDANEALGQMQMNFELKPTPAE